MFGETLPNKRLVEKMLISLTPAYDNIVSVIEGTKKLDEIDPKEVVATLKGFEQKLKRQTKDEAVSDKASQYPKQKWIIDHWIQWEETFQI